jgi:hypothetical protein
MGSRGIALLILKLGARRGWKLSTAPRPLYPPGKTRYTLYRRLGGPQCRSGRVRKISPPPGFFFICSYLVLHCYGIGLSMVVCIVSYCMLWIFPAGKIRRFFFNEPFLPLRQSTFNCRLCRVVLRAVDYSREKSDGFGRERTRDLGFQRPARKPLDHRSRYGFGRERTRDIGYQRPAC